MRRKILDSRFCYIIFFLLLWYFLCYIQIQVKRANNVVNRWFKTLDYEFRREWRLNLMRCVYVIECELPTPARIPFPLLFTFSSWKDRVPFDWPSVLVSITRTNHDTYNSWRLCHCCTLHNSAWISGKVNFEQYIIWR